MKFPNRQKAGEQLASHLQKYQHQDVLVLAIPNGGVEVGLPIASALNAPLFVIGARKIGFAVKHEWRIGAISEGDAESFDTESLKVLGIESAELEEIIQAEKKELKKQIKLFRNGSKLPDFKDKTIILVDEGVDSGLTAKATIEFLRQKGYQKLIFATPLIRYSLAEEISLMVDHFLTLNRVLDFNSIASGYEDYSRLSDKQALDLLNQKDHLNPQWYRHDSKRSTYLDGI